MCGGGGACSAISESIECVLETLNKNHAGFEDKMLLSKAAFYPA
ncbi:hypothetical protein GCM10008922_09460 [Faecalicatena contorta]